MGYGTDEVPLAGLLSFRMQNVSVVIDGKRRDGSYAHVFCLGFLSPASGLRTFSDEEQMVRVFRGSGIPPHEVSRISQAVKTRERTLTHVTQQQAELLHLVDHAS